eukprot:3734937-Pyramimonas_sp.AAC.1
MSGEPHVDVATGGVPVPYGSRNVSAVCPHWRGTACGLCHWVLRWSSTRGHETCEGCARMGGNSHTDLVTGAL